MSKEGDIEKENSSKGVNNIPSKSKIDYCIEGFVISLYMLTLECGIQFMKFQLGRTKLDGNFNDFSSILHMRGNTSQRAFMKLLFNIKEPIHVLAYNYVTKQFEKLETSFYCNSFLDLFELCEELYKKKELLKKTDINILNKVKIKFMHNNYESLHYVKCCLLDSVYHFNPNTTFRTHYARFSDIHTESMRTTLSVLENCDTIKQFLNIKKNSWSSRSSLITSNTSNSPSNLPANPQVPQVPIWNYQVISVSQPSTSNLASNICSIYNQPNLGKRNRDSDDKLKDDVSTKIRKLN